MGSNPSQYYGVGGNYPVYKTTWFKTIEYCNRRSILEGHTPCYSYNNGTDYGTNPAGWPAGWDSADNNHLYVLCNWSANGFRLPTDMESMFASMGGILSAGYTYSGSNNIDVVGWYVTNSSNLTHIVGTKSANELGIFDMCGNVYEWCWDIYATLPNGNQTNPHGPTSGGTRVVRGGCFINQATLCTNTSRTQIVPTSTGYTLGFRLCRNAQ